MLLSVFAYSVQGEGLTDLFMSPADEQRIGAAEHDKILAEFGGAYDDAALARYVDSIDQYLALTSSKAGSGFTFTVLNTPVVNAFALPGGYIYVTRGLLALADNEAELAGVLAHQIGHVAARHSAKGQTKGTLAGIGLAIFGAATESSSALGLGQVGASAVISSYSHEDEYEADLLGVQYLSRAGFSAQSMASFLQILKAYDGLQVKLYGQSTGAGLDFFATHPRTEDSVRKAAQNASTVNVSEPIVAADIYLSKIDGMLYGDDPSQGLTIGQRFVPPDLRIEFTVPDGFVLLNGESAVVAHGPSGAGIKCDTGSPQSGGNMVRYIRNHWAERLNVEALQRIDVNGRRGATGVIRGVQNGQADVRLVAIYFRKQVRRFTFLIPRRPGNRLGGAVQRTMFSFRSLPSDQLGNLQG